VCLYVSLSVCKSKNDISVSMCFAGVRGAQMTMRLRVCGSDSVG
jgi:hypothetical protein